MIGASRTQAGQPPTVIQASPGVTLRSCAFSSALRSFLSRGALSAAVTQTRQLGFPPKLLQRFLRGFVVATAHGLVTAPASVCRACGSASVYVGAREQMIWMNRIFARVMSGFVMREEVRLQAAAAARIAGKSGIIAAAGSGDVADVLSYLITHTGWANERR